jgi:hypothetical protein
LFDREWTNGYCEGQLWRRSPRDFQQRIRHAVAWDVPMWRSDQSHGTRGRGCRCALGEVDVGIHWEQVLANPAITRTRILRSPVGLYHFGLRGLSSCQWRRRLAHARARLLNHPTGREPALQRAAGTATTPNVDLCIINTPNERELKAAINSLRLHRTTPPTTCLSSHFSATEHLRADQSFFGDKASNAIGYGGMSFSIAYGSVATGEEQLKVDITFHIGLRS